MRAKYRILLQMRVTHEKGLGTNNNRTLAKSDGAKTCESERQNEHR